MSYKVVSHLFPLYTASGTPVDFQDPSAMTPDTAEFPKDAAWPSAKPWTEDEDGIIEAVRHLPHSRLRVTVIDPN